MVKEVRMTMPKLGTRKLYHILESELKELKVGRDQLFRILRSNNLLIKPKKRYHITTNSHHRFRKHKNIIENLAINKPEQVWVSDITYIGTRLNPMYLSLVTDAYSKKIMGYNVSDSLATDGSLKALKMACKNRIRKESPLIHHSDRGLQYCSNQYQSVLRKKGLDCSMTESYDPYQNAVAERINGVLKQEFLCNMTIKNIEIMNMVIKSSINIYNQKRPHYSCRYLTPMQMHLQNKIKMRTYKNEKYSKD
jgi:putative transposase